MPWSYHKALLSIEDKDQRLKFLKQVEEEDWDARRLQIKVRDFNWAERVASSNGKLQAPLPPVCLGPLYTYRVISRTNLHTKKDELLLDKGHAVKVRS